MSNCEKRFIKTYSQSGFSTSVAVWVDRETGVNYLVCDAGTGCGLTPLLNRDGTPVISPLMNREDS